MEYASSAASNPQATSMPINISVSASGVAILRARSRTYSGQKINASTTARKIGSKIESRTTP